MGQETRRWPPLPEGYAALMPKYTREMYAMTGPRNSYMIRYLEGLAIRVEDQRRSQEQQGQGITKEARNEELAVLAALKVGPAP
jgi:hypothetical protein